MKKPILFTLLLSLLLLSGQGWGGTDYFVNGDKADDSGDGLTPDTAKKTINAARQLMGGGDADRLFVKKASAPYRERVYGPNSDGDASNYYELYFNATGDGTTISLDPDDQALIYASVPSTDYIWTASAGTTNAVTNGGFETCDGCTPNDTTTDNFGTWSETPGTGGYADMDTNEVGIPEGSNCCDLYSGSTNSRMLIVVTLSANTEYVVQYWGRSDGSAYSDFYIREATGSFLWLQDDGSTWNATENYQLDSMNFLTSQTSWTKKKKLFTTNSSTSFNVFIFNKGTNSHLWLDDLIICPVREYYAEAGGGGNPSLVEPGKIWIDNGDDTFAMWNSGTVGSLNDHTFGYGDEDYLGYDTVYVRDNSGDPDDTGIILEIPQENATLTVQKSYGKYYGGIHRFSNDSNVVFMNATPTLTNVYAYYMRSQYARWHGLNSYADPGYFIYCIADHNYSKGIQNHGDGDLNSDIDLYVYNCVAFANTYYGIVAYGKLHLRNCISYNNGQGQFFKQVADPGNDIDPDEQYCLWYSTTTEDRDWEKTGEEVLPATHATSIVADPLFKSATDLHLTFNSPGKDGGTEWAGAPNSDIEGNYAPRGAARDIGAYERKGSKISALMLPSLSPFINFEQTR